MKEPFFYWRILTIFAENTIIFSSTVCYMFSLCTILLETSDLTSQMQLIETSYSICYLNNKSVMLYIFIIHSAAVSLISLDPIIDHKLYNSEKIFLIEKKFLTFVNGAVALDWWIQIPLMIISWCTVTFSCPYSSFCRGTCFCVFAML